MLSSYPTLGPQADTPVLLEVNGSAASLELYLGIDVLQEPDGQTLTPVQWTGYIAGLRRYQGEVLQKRRLQQAFDAKLGASELIGQCDWALDWSGIVAIADAIVRVWD